MIVVAVCVYNKLDNIKHWIDCWNKCETDGAKLVIIHNHYNEPGLKELFEKLCKESSIQYIPSDKKGFDIGRFQDVCKRRLKGFPEYGYLLWASCDCFPMQVDFINKYLDAIKGNDVACMQISPYVRKHIRTTGFMITRAAAERLIFPADPVETKEHCYLFEHRDPKRHFLAQVKAVQVAPDRFSPMWDVGYGRKVDRKKEHVQLFGSYIEPEEVEQQETVTIICPIYQEFPAIISCLIMQTNPNWKLQLVHNGPSDGSVEQYVTLIDDNRISYEETKEASGNWGHKIRSEWLQKVESKYVIITSPDNYYVPTFIEKCLRVFVVKGVTVGVYSKQMVHNYTDWNIINCRMARGFIDCGSMMLKAKEAKEVGWKDITSHSADWFYFNDLLKRYGPNKFLPVKGVLYVHNTILFIVFATVLIS